MSHFDWLTENIPYPLCHENVLYALYSTFNHLLLERFICSMKSEMVISRGSVQRI